MSDQPRGMLQLRRTAAATSPGASTGILPALLAALVGLAVAAVPSLLNQLLPPQTINDASEHAQPLLAVTLAAPLLLVMVVASLGDMFRGKSSPWALLRHLTALAFVLGCSFLGVTLLQQLNFASGVAVIVVGFLLIGFGFGVGVTFTAGVATVYTDTSLAIIGWVACMLVALTQLVISVLTYKPPLDQHGLGFSLGNQLFCCPAFILAFIIGVTAVPLGGVVGGWLRRGKQ